MEDIPEDENEGAPEAVITFSWKYKSGIYPYNDDPMVITVKYEEYDIKRVLVDQGSSADILYWDTFKIAPRPQSPEALKRIIGRILEKSGLGEGVSNPEDHVRRIGPGQGNQG